MSEGKMEEAMSMLFSARWNVPKAAQHCGMTWEECEVAFREFCKRNPPAFDKLGNPVKG